MKFFSYAWMTATFFAFICLQLRNHNFLFSTIFALIYIVGFLLRKKQIFWKLSFLFFSLSAIAFFLGILGGMEPARRNTYPYGDWFGVYFYLFLLSGVSAAAAFISGLIAAKYSHENQIYRKK